mmetsp:Transcript_49905/g.108964  ORF Transcript_49905/g.108964 Transcript_49905/m.108964 type:complete len:201 (+) Transcript_49905:2032-2634(+)
MRSHCLEFAATRNAHDLAPHQISQCDRWNTPEQPTPPCPVNAPSWSRAHPPPQSCARRTRELACDFVYSTTAGCHGGLQQESCVNTSERATRMRHHRQEATLIAHLTQCLLGDPCCARGQPQERARRGSLPCPQKRTRKASRHTTRQSTGSSLQNWQPTAAQIQQSTWSGLPPPPLLLLEPPWSEYVHQDSVIQSKPADS